MQLLSVRFPIKAHIFREKMSLLTEKETG